MPILQVSFQNTSTTKQNQQQNVAVSPIVKSSTRDTVEISTKKKDNQALKYALIGLPYSSQNVEKIEKLVNGKWQKVEFLPKTKRSGFTIPRFREEGDSRLLFNNLTAEEKSILSIFLSKRQFTKNDYDNLSEPEIKVLRSFVNRTFQRKSLFKGDKEHPVRSIAKDLDFMIKVTDGVEESLKSRHPKGFTMVALGGSPSLIRDIMIARGYDCKCIPFSTAFFDETEAKSFNFEKYLNKFGINRTNSKNTNFVYLDYVQMGHTKQVFENLMTLNGFDYQFENITDLFGRLSPKDAAFMRDYFLQGTHIKAYTTCPKLTEHSQYANIYDVIKKYEWGNPAKLMRFAIFDKFGNVNL